MTVGFQGFIWTAGVFSNTVRVKVFFFFLLVLSQNVKDLKTGEKKSTISESAKRKSIILLYRMCFKMVSGMLGVQHLGKQGVTGQVPQQVALVQVLLYLQADAAYFRQPEQQLAEFIRLAWVCVQSVVHQSPVHPLLGALHLPAVLHRFHICTTHTQTQTLLL